MYLIFNHSYSITGENWWNRIEPKIHFYFEYFVGRKADSEAVQMKFKNMFKHVRLRRNRLMIDPHFHI